MAQDKMNRMINAKLDRIAAELGIDTTAADWAQGQSAPRLTTEGSVGYGADPQEGPRRAADEQAQQLQPGQPNPTGSQPPAADGFPPPWPDYAEMTVEQVLERAATLDDAQREQVRRYEEQGKGRKGIVERLVNWNS